MQIENLKNELSNVVSNTIGHVTTMTCQKSKVSKKVAASLGIDPESVMKQSEIQVQFGSDYSTRVKNQLKRENKDNDFQAKEAFYRMVAGSLAVNKKDESKYYAIATPMPNSKGKTKWFINGKEVAFATIEKIFNPSALKSYGTRQGTDKEIKHLAIGLNSITRIALNGKVIL